MLKRVQHDARRRVVDAVAVLSMGCRSDRRTSSRTWFGISFFKGGLLDEMLKQVQHDARRRVVDAVAVLNAGYGSERRTSSRT